MPKARVDEIMTSRVVTITPDTSLREVGEIFSRHHFHHLLVVENKKLQGLISDRDFLKFKTPFVGTTSERRQDSDLLTRKAHHIMTRNPVTVLPWDDVKGLLDFFLESEFSCLPVTNDKNEIEGVVTWRDLLRYLASCDIFKK